MLMTTPIATALLRMKSRPPAAGFQSPVDTKKTSTLPTTTAIASPNIATKKPCSNPPRFLPPDHLNPESDQSARLN